MKMELSDGMIRAGSHSYAGKAWVAKIVGPDPKFRLARSFENKRDVDTTGNVYRELEWAFAAAEGDIYEYFDQVSSGRSERGFWVVEGGRLITAEYSDVIRRINNPAAVAAVA